jgi:hypothetical protein
VDITKLPKRNTFLKSLRARISSSMPNVSQVCNLQVPHFDTLLQICDLLGSFVFKDLNNLCVNMDPDQHHEVLVTTDNDKFAEEMCAQEWHKQTHAAEFIQHDPEKQFLLLLMFCTDKTGTSSDTPLSHSSSRLQFYGTSCMRDPHPGGMRVSCRRWQRQIIHVNLLCSSTMIAW